MSIDHEQDWDNYWHGRAARNSGDALVGVGIEDNAKLTEFWIDVFKAAAKSTRVVDFACGAGSALKHADTIGLTDLTGVDIAEQAISVLKQAIPNVKTCVSPVDETPFHAGEFDHVVSQFGFEYAGDEGAVLAAAREMIRVLKPSGTFTAIVHIEGGAIEQESQSSLANIQMVLESDFTQRAQQMFKTVYPAESDPTPQNQEMFMQALVGMSQAEGQVIEWLKSSQAQGNEFARFGRYLVSSTREMFERHKALELAECLKWLDDMQHEILAYKGRMVSMIEAALSEDMVSKIMAEFTASGYKAERPKPFFFNPSDLPVAWVLNARS